MIGKIKNMEIFICKKKSGKNINLKNTDCNKKTFENVGYCNLKDHTFSLYIKKHKQKGISWTK